MSDLETEAVLDTNIQFQGPLAKNWQNPPSVFLTGASGFIGAYLLQVLLNETQADIYCLVRSRDSDEGKQRLTRQLQFYQLWNERYHSRIIPVVGDLSQPFLGLSESQFGDLSRCIEVIYHNGAQVNAARPYADLKKPNVLGTQEVLRLAGMTQTKPVHFISSIAVFFSPAHHNADITETAIPDGKTLSGGYRQSKWVAEQLVLTAQKRGLPATIHRVGRVWGHTQTGIMGNLNDSLCGLLKSCIQMGTFPIADVEVNVAPVDYISQAICRLSNQQESFGKVFHLLNAQSISWKVFFEHVRTLGYSLEEVSEKDWTAQLKKRASAKPKEELYSRILLMLRLSAFFSENKPRFQDGLTQEGLAGSGIHCPPLDVNLLSTYFSYFHKSGYIHKGEL
ncbi:MAG: thioester reductase domain-containing protein [SAR324 cluster bacterium]|nr:thioester reductase domain-containing protein [SAR324 cluster bacterium]